MRNGILYLLLLALGFFIVSCGETSSDEVYTVNGYKVEFIEGPSKPAVQPGQIAKVSFRYSTPDSNIVPKAQETEFRIPRESQNIPDVIDGTMLMGEGDSINVTIPFDSIPDQAKANPLFKNGVIYHIRLLEIVDSAEFAQEQARKEEERMAKLSEVDSLMNLYLGKFTNGTIDNLQELGDGLKVLKIKETSNSPLKSGNNVAVNYYGKVIESGVMFDNSYSRGKPFNFKLGSGQVIQGWDKALPQFSKGEEGIVFIPAALAYGDKSAGKIPANSDLAFYIEVIE